MRPGGLADSIRFSSNHDSNAACAMRLATSRPVDKGGQALRQAANIGPDAGVVAVKDRTAFIAAAKTRQWAWEKFVRTLA